MKSLFGAVSAMTCGLLALTAATMQSASAEEMIAGKPYSVTEGSEPGTYMCTWGDEKVEWKPKAWHPRDYVDVGPNIYDRWVQPGLPYPWEIPVEARLQNDGREVHDRSYTALYFNEFGENYITEWSIDLTSPDGTQRNKKLFEWMIAYRQNPEGLPKSLVGKVRAQYMFTFVAPNDFRGLGISTTIYHGEKFNDEFLYTPAARRVRRLPQAARQDIVPGTIVRWEDFPQVKTISGYRLQDRRLHALRRTAGRHFRFRHGNRRREDQHRHRRGMRAFLHSGAYPAFLVLLVCQAAPHHRHQNREQLV